MKTILIVLLSTFILPVLYGPLGSSARNIPCISGGCLSFESPAQVPFVDGSEDEQETWSIGIKSYAVMDHEDERRKFILWLNSNRDTVNQKPMCFYSGFTVVNGRSVHTYTKMKAFANARQCWRIHDLIRFSQSSSREWNLEDWTAASGAVATMTGNVDAYVLLGETVAQDSVWVVAERPALMENELVHSVKAWTLGSDGKFGTDPSDIIKPAHLDYHQRADENV